MKRLLIGSIAAALLALAGCSDDGTPAAASAGVAPGDGEHDIAEHGEPLVVVHLSPTCGCCMDWVEHIRDAGFATEVHEEPNVNATRWRLGVPHELASCHTAVVDGYLIEGHVPAADIRRLLEERPDARGLAVPDMPIGSPGMEMGDRRDAYDVLLFDAHGTEVFSSYPG